ncbi:hypothetical protein NLM27_33370 [Bradyrhizobium sp. CCGB12]|uniref:hypothetical protein n=1 Tax=Bradyrhizobium sp. CCGB12 TaxID=2949632 RepID=UPI0020B388CA|nr:hypothetical protein [Bradyrhizobium sp. CCGB12]MCP3393652.1 hypothetical protein [Bradyrhizobium sp. CCGB12]
MRMSVAEDRIERANCRNLLGRRLIPPLFAMFFLLWIAGPACAQQPPAATVVGPAESAFERLPGRWVRLQGGYVITIRAVGADGKLDASYANPTLLPFHVAVASRDGNAIKLRFELRAGGYNGSSYVLNYDAANDRLTGVFDQVVAKQKFDVVFVRFEP